MTELNQFRNAIIKLQSCFKGLPHEPASLIKSLITLADPRTGMVSGLTWDDVSSLLEVTKKPGRKSSGIPSKEKTREYISTILMQCPDDFRMATVGQKLQFQFINMPSIYAEFFNQNREVPTDLPIELTKATGLENTGFEEGFNSNSNRENPMEVPTDLPTPELPVKNNNIYIINKHNKQTSQENENKKLIADDFYPTASTIAEAKALGLNKVEDITEISEFIKKNQAWGRRFADFNPIFLQWLKRDFNPNNAIASQHQQPTQKLSRNQYDRPSHQATSSKPTLAELRKRNEEIIREAEERASSCLDPRQYCTSVVISV